ncbi:MAG: L,D-transpeptidase family protein [Anaerolineae bacterium]|nr:L,D-transpeptidase family protein [Anaerolineae bacterium]
MLNKRELPQRSRLPGPTIQPPARRPARAQRRPVKHRLVARPVYQAAVAQSRQLPPAPVPQARARLPRARAQGTAKSSRRWLWYAIVGAPLVGVVGLLLIGMVAMLILWGGGRILPMVSVGGVPVGGMSAEQASALIAETWQGRGVVLRDGAAEYPVAADVLGITLDSGASAAAALDYGRANGGLGGFLRGLFSRTDVPPVATLDAQAFAAGLAEVAPHVETQPRNAGVQFVNGQVRPRSAVDGRLIDIPATVRNFEQNSASELADGTVDLVMYTVAPQIVDPTPVVAAAQALLANPFEIRGYNPATGEDTYWTVMPEEWGEWLTAGDSALGLAADDAMVRTYLEAQEGSLPASTSIDLDEATQAIDEAIAEGNTQAAIRVYNQDRQHTVQAGETITSIAWDYGVPYLYIERANPGVSSLSVGQTITIPSADTFLELPVVPDKRVVVSISEQRVRVYENGDLKWDWVASTGIDSSPTWPGIYQIISHEPNAYAGNWDLWMPNFMGVYRPIPDTDFTNGFHGFPTRGGSQLLWTNSLGTRVTYGCILISDDHIRQLYDWAEDGVVVQITP